jgi:hypothetical protein
MPGVKLVFDTAFRRKTARIQKELTSGAPGAY